MPTTYKVDIRNLTYAELWRLAPGLAFLFAAPHKLFGIPRKLGARASRLDTITLVAEADVPADVAALMRQSIQDWKALGFSMAFFYTIPAARQGQRSCAAALLSADGGTVAQVMFVEVCIQGITRRELVTNCFSLLADGTLVGATTEKSRIQPPPQFKAVRLPGRSPSALYERARKELELAKATYAVSQTPESLKDLIVDINHKHVDYQVSRGVYVPVDAPL